MSKKKTDDPGLVYMKSLGLRGAKTAGALVDMLRTASDEATAKAVIEEIDLRVNENRLDGKIYEIKNKTLDLSMALSAAFNAELYRKFCNWICGHKEVFGKSILEVGCDCGIITCFLGKMFPDSHILGIDKCEQAIKNAQELADRLGVKNTEFRCLDLTDMQEQFDTVFSMLTVHENRIEAEKDLSAKFFEAADMLVPQFQDYANAVSKNLNDEGVFVSVERLKVASPMFPSWIKALANTGLYFEEDKYEHWVCQEFKQESVFGILIADRQKPSGFNEDGWKPYECYLEAVAPYINFREAELYGWEASLTYELKRGDFIKGFVVSYPMRNIVVETSLWMHKYDNTAILLYYRWNNDVRVTVHDISMQEGLLKLLDDSVKESEKEPGRVLKWL